MNGLARVTVIVMCLPILSACGGAQKSGSDNSKQLSSLDKLRTISDRLTKSADRVTAPIDALDAVLVQVDTVPKKLRIARGDFVEILSSVLTGKPVKFPANLTGAAKQEMQGFVDNFDGAARGVRGIPGNAESLVVALGAASVEIPALAGKAKAEIKYKQSKLAVNPFSSASEKQQVEAEASGLATIEADAKNKVAALQEKMMGLPQRARASVGKFTRKLGALGLGDLATGLVSGTNEPADRRRGLRKGGGANGADAQFAGRRSTAAPAAAGDREVIYGPAAASNGFTLSIGSGMSLSPANVGDQDSPLPGSPDVNLRVGYRLNKAVVFGTVAFRREDVTTSKGRCIEEDAGFEQGCKTWLAVGSIKSLLTIGAGLRYFFLAPGADRTVAYASAGLFVTVPDQSSSKPDETEALEKLMEGSTGLGSNIGGGAEYFVSEGCSIGGEAGFAYHSMAGAAGYLGLSTLGFYSALFLNLYL